MIISTFELLVKRIAPVSGDPANAGQEAPFRRIIQGYFLTISNPSLKRKVTFRIRATIPIAIPADLFGRSFTESTDTLFIFPPPNPKDNHFIAFDKTGPNEFSQFKLFDQGPVGMGTDTYRRFRSKKFTLGPGQSCALEILPNVLNDAVIKSEKMEIRGFVEIYQPYVFFPTPNADLILTPEHRGTLLDNKYKAPYPDPATSSLDFDQVAYSLPLASGKSLNKVGSEKETYADFYEINELSATTAVADDIDAMNEELSAAGLKVVKL